MEDPWANAWGEPSKPSFSAHAVTSASNSWVAPSVSVIHGDHEDDLSAPAWPTKPTAAWGDPDIAETSLWGSDASAGWTPAPSTFDRISLSSKESLTENDSELSSVEPVFIERPNSIVSSPSTSSASDSEEHHHNDTPSFSEPPQSPPKTPSPPPVVPPLSLPQIDDADGFGTFETAVEDADGWETPQKSTFALASADAMAWGTQPWEAPNPAAEGADTREEDDEWEIARRQKEKQDQHVPPELLAAILHTFDELSDELWPKAESSTENEEPKERSISIDDLGLNAVMQRLVPQDLVLPPMVSFSKTFTAKQLSEALKLTRHSHLTRASPMALYMASKGSISWEKSIKAKPNITQDDVIPVGWKIVETNKEESLATDDGKKKPSGGLLSFFGRRGTAPTPSESAKRSASPANSTKSSVKTGASPRASIDGGRPSTSQSVKSMPSSPSVGTFASSISKSSVQTNESKTSPALESYGNPSKDPMDAIVREPTPPPPSAVSRFLDRFSRSKSSSKDSLALSSNDLEFLSEVPSLHGPEADNDSSLDALSMMLKSPPLPTALPPPLAPPPKAPPKPPQMPPPPVRQPQNADFMSFFDNLSDSAQGSAQTNSPFALLTAVPTPPVKPSLGQVSSNSSFQSLHVSMPSSSSIPTVTLTVGTPDTSSDQTPRPLRSSNEQSWSSFDYPSTPTPMNKLPSSSSKRTFVPIMSSSRSSTAVAPPLLPKPTSSFALPPPPSANSRTTNTVDLLSGTNSVISPLPPPPSSRSHTPLRVQQPIQPIQPIQPPAQAVHIDDDDDFSDFLSSPAHSTNPGYTPFNTFAAPAQVANLPKSPIPTSQPAAATSNTFGDFGDFLDPPPQPPAKSVPPKTHNGPVKPANGLIRKVSKHDHNRTMSLLETAASRGRWLNPPSPLPEALQPPPPNNKSSKVDFFGSGGGTMQAQQAQAVASLTASYSAPAKFLDSNGNSAAVNKPLPPWSFPPPIQATPLKASSPPPSIGYVAPMQPPIFQTSQSQNGNGINVPKGPASSSLSAQDLSFFESF